MDLANLAKNVSPRQEGQRAVAFSKRNARQTGLDGGEHSTMTEHHTLGITRGPRRVHDFYKSTCIRVLSRNRVLLTHLAQAFIGLDFRILRVT